MALKGGVGVPEVLVVTLTVGVIVAEVDVVALEVGVTALELVIALEVVFALEVGVTALELVIALEVVFALEVGVIVADSEVDVVVPEVDVGLGGGGGWKQDTPAASLFKQKMMVPDGHSSKLFSLPVHSQSLTQMFPAPTPKSAPV